MDRQPRRRGRGGAGDRNHRTGRGGAPRRRAGRQERSGGPVAQHGGRGQRALRAPRRRGARARRRLRRGDRRGPSPPEEGFPVGDRAADGRGDRRRPRSRPRRRGLLRPQGRHRRATAPRDRDHDRARWRRDRRSQRALPRPRRAPRDHPPCVVARHLRSRRGAGRALARRSRSRSLRPAGRARPPSVSARRRPPPVDYRTLATEQIHPRADRIDRLSTDEVVALLLAEEARAVRAVARRQKAIVRAARLFAATLAGDGRVIYAGAGTSGRLGVLDAAELPPTFGTDPGRVIALLAGGPRAITHSAEGAEDRPAEATQAIARLQVGPGDLVCAIAASGVTPFTLAALVEAGRRGAATVFITCSPRPGRALADVTIAVPVGPEVIAGSTRLKAGTATKLVLNAISTAAMIRLGKVYRGRMVDLCATNAKLRQRALRMVEELAAVSPRRAARLLTDAKGRVKIALAAALLDLPIADAEARLDAAGGSLAALVPGGSRRR
ncbi:MAG: N-acetylmuramic acid 6-phosphate etherase [Myxococcales bacterium]|nr:N-acetylmuramic acid 6-phosphate etherase [Myxococcales bacterium]